MPSALEELELLNPSVGNRVATWICLIVGLVLIGDMAVRVGEKGFEGFQYIRHPAGILAVAWVSFVYARMLRRATVLIAAASEELAAAHAPEDWPDDERAEFLSRLPYEKLARTFTLWGTGALRRALRREIRAAASRIE